MCLLQLNGIGITFEGWSAEVAFFTLDTDIYIYQIIPVVPHKAVAEVSKIGNL